MNKVIGVNGILSHGLHGTDDALRDLARVGYRTYDLDYPVRSALQVYFDKIRLEDAAKLYHAHDEGDHVIAHSYGCLVTLEAMMLGAKFGHVFFFGAAATSDRSPWFKMATDACDRLHVIYNPDDLALKLGSLLPYHPFGKLGHSGYRGPKDDRVVSIMGKTGKDGLLRHNLHLSDKYRDKYVKYIITNIGEPDD